MYNTRKELVLTKEELYHNYVNEKLREAEEWAANPNAKWLTHEEVMRGIKEKHGI